MKLRKKLNHILVTTISCLVIFQLFGLSLIFDPLFLFFFFPSPHFFFNSHTALLRLSPSRRGSHPLPGSCCHTWLSLFASMCVACGQCLQDTSQYVLSELTALEAEQKHIDSRAAVVERRLRNLMETGESQPVSANVD